MPNVLPYVRKKDFVVTFDIPGVDDDILVALSKAIRSVKTSFLHNIVVLEVRHEIDTDVHYAVEYMCRKGLAGCGVHTVNPNAPSPSKPGTGHLSYEYAVGCVLDHVTAMCTDEIDGEEEMVDELQIMFRKKTQF